MILLYFGLIIISSLWIMKACDPFEESANFLGRNMTDGIKGATINAIASSIPELLTTFICLFIFKDTAGFETGIGTTAGSAVFNAMVIPSLCILCVLFFIKKTTGFHISKATIIRDGIFLLISEAVLILILSNQNNVVILNWKHGLMLIGVYFTYTTYMYLQYKIKANNINTSLGEEIEEQPNQNWLIKFINFDYRNMFHHNGHFTNRTAWASLSLSIVHLAIACHIMVFSVIKISHYFGLHPFFIAIIVAAAATSVPDTVISIRDALKGNYDDSIANAVGSNIFDICICLGLPLVLYSLFIDHNIVIHSAANIQNIRIVLFILSALIIGLLIFAKLNVYVAVSLFLGYVIYAVYSVLSGVQNQPFWVVFINDKISIISNAVNLF